MRICIEAGSMTRYVRYKVLIFPSRSDKVGDTLLPSHLPFTFPLIFPPSSHPLLIQHWLNAVKDLGSAISRHDADGNNAQQGPEE